MRGTLLVRGAAQYKRWSDIDKLAHLRLCLVGPAEDLFYSVGDVTYSSKSLDNDTALGSKPRSFNQSSDTGRKDNGDAAGVGWRGRQADPIGVSVRRRRKEGHPGSRRVCRRSGRSSAADRHPAAEPDVTGCGAHTGDEAGRSQPRCCTGQRRTTSTLPTSSHARLLTSKPLTRERPRREQRRSRCGELSGRLAVETTSARSLVVGQATRSSVHILYDAQA